MRNVKKISFILTIIFSFTVLLSNMHSQTASAAFVPDIDRIYSEGVYMVNLDRDIVIYEKNAQERFYPASITKIMTAIVALENCKNLDDYVSIGYSATNEFWEGDPNKTGASNAALEAFQENVTYRDCIYALMLVSACEAANVLALNLAGSIEGFVGLMNQKAAEIGCLDTHFANTHGLWESDNYSTPYDMYLITKYAYDNVKDFMEICDTYEYVMPANENNPDGYTKYTTNPLITPSSEFYREYAHGIKTGSIDYYYSADGATHAGGRCLVSTAKQDGNTYMIVSMQAPFFNEAGERYNFNALDHVNLYDWVFANVSEKEVLEENKILAEVKVEQGDGADSVQLISADKYSTLLTTDLETAVQMKVNKNAETITAPVKKGDVLGSVELILAGETLAVIDLVAQKSIERSQLAYIADRVGSLVDEPWFMPLVVLLVILIIVELILMHMRRRQLEAAARRSARRKR